LKLIFILLTLAASTSAQTTVHVTQSDKFTPPYTMLHYARPPGDTVQVYSSIDEIPRTCKRYFFPAVLTAYAPVDQKDPQLESMLKTKAKEMNLYAIIYDVLPPAWALKTFSKPFPRMDSTGYDSRRCVGVLCLPGGGSAGRIGTQ